MSGQARHTGSVGASDPFAVFRPRRGRRVAQVVAVIAVVLFGGIALLMPSATIGATGGWHAGDRLLFFGCGLAVAALMWRYATIRAVPTEHDLVVRNLVTSRRVPWSSVVQVQYGASAPWVSLELDDADLVAVMAIQRADGARSSAEASRLAALAQGLAEREMRDARGGDGRHVADDGSQEPTA